MLVYQRVSGIYCQKARTIIVVYKWHFSLPIGGSKMPPSPPFTSFYGNQCLPSVLDSPFFRAILEVQRHPSVVLMEVQLKRGRVGPRWKPCPHNDGQLLVLDRATCLMTGRPIFGFVFPFFVMQWSCVKLHLVSLWYDFAFYSHFFWRNIYVGIRKDPKVPSDVQRWVPEKEIQHTCSWQRAQSH